ncbi:hypothetical protein OnM2_c2065o63 [Erysiphe neolycopersici]|uniref:Uncharacterized protein n=1 Tax=Erysiphe neolycopersici TaxID=212602 RepID=A0A420I1Q2_9PEZI|nr:hypothetical protein OnM2_c2065o63 [Erysiphe neolycopersici]
MEILLSQLMIKLWLSANSTLYLVGVKKWIQNVSTTFRVNRTCESCRYRLYDYPYLSQ